MAVAFALWLAQVVVQGRYLAQRTGHPWSWFVYRFILSQFATIPFCVAGIELFLGTPNATYWLVPGFIFSFHRRRAQIPLLPQLRRES
ncbi:MAG: hypothetical protein WDO73_06085 [Ignavibacteriota bacterium]